MNLEIIIGLEIHVQLKTKSKMFCGCSNDGEDQPPNTTVCEVCLGHPGVLPVLNKQAIEWAVKTALALNCTINTHEHFDRKNYFYPDLSKGYQISQFDKPIGEHGFLEFRPPIDKGGRARVGITRLHLEEDAAKNIHPSTRSGHTGKMLIDYNRGGTPLMEIVTEPDIRTPQEAKVFLHELRLIMRYLGVSDADMEKGHLRCDANISLREIVDLRRLNSSATAQLGTGYGVNEREQTMNPKTEIKNLNSFKMVERALEYEIQRQTKLWENGILPREQSTRGWNDAEQVTHEQRTKEGSADYRYFPEPDIPLLRVGTEKQKNRKTEKPFISHVESISALDDEKDQILKHAQDETLGILDGINIENINNSIPELPIAKRERLVSEYGIKYADAKVLTEDKHLVEYFEQVISELRAWLESLDTVEGSTEEVWDKNKGKLMKLVSGWLINRLGGIVSDCHIGWKDVSITPENFAEFITFIYRSKLNSTTGQTVLRRMLETGDDPSHIIEDQSLEQMSNIQELERVIESILNNNPNEVARYKAGKKELVKFFIGQVMKETKGRANPSIIEELFK